MWWDWSACCAVHDRDYALGIVKDVADDFLSICVNSVLPGMGDLMWVGLVVVFGWASRWLYARAQTKKAGFQEVSLEIAQEKIQNFRAGEPDTLESLTARITKIEAKLMSRLRRPS